MAKTRSHTLAVTAGDPAHGARLLATADELFATTGATRWPAERLGGPVTMDTLRASFSEEAVTATTAAGGGLSLGHAIDEATTAPREQDRAI